MVVVGTDVHKRTHTFVAVNEVGRKLGEKVVAATTAGHGKALVWARTEFGGDVLWGIEDSRNLSARLERDLLSAGQKVVRVAAKLMNQARKFARTRGKSDPIDALDDSVAVGPLVPTATGSAPVTRSPDRADPLAPTRRFPSRAAQGPGLDRPPRLSLGRSVEHVLAGPVAEHLVLAAADLGRLDHRTGLLAGPCGPVDPP